MKRAGLVVAAVLGIGFAPSSAGATPPGPPGYSGKPNLLDTAGAGCTKCHGGGPTPTLSLTGPDTLAALGTGTYTLKVTATSGTVRCMVAATDQAVLTPASATVEKSFDELTPATSGGGTCVFQLKAPAKGPLTIWYAGASMNGRGTGGDGYASAKKDITVTTTASDAGPVPGADAGPNGAVDSGVTHPGPKEADGGTTAPGAAQDDVPADGGCTSAPSSEAPLVAALAAVFGLLIARRRRRA